MKNHNHRNNCRPGMQDCGPEPFVTNLAVLAARNNNFRTAVWTGHHLQMTVMCIEPGDCIGLEQHPDTDQCLLIEQGTGCSMMGPTCDCLNIQVPVSPGCAIFVPACTWHNVINTGCCPLKLCSFYAPPNHPRGTVHRTKCEAEAEEYNPGNKKEHHKRDCDCDD